MKCLSQNLYCFLASGCLLFAVNGCEWDDALTSPGKATVDKQLLGFWKISSLDLHGKSSSTMIYAISECSKIDISHPKWPRGAMIIKSLELNSVTDNSKYLGIAWPTRNGNTSYINATTYDLESNHLLTGRKAFMIFKYEIDGDGLTVYELPEEIKKRMRSRLGVEYNAADLHQEITKQTAWKVRLKGERIK